MSPLARACYWQASFSQSSIQITWISLTPYPQSRVPAFCKNSSKLVVCHLILQNWTLHERASLPFRWKARNKWISGCTCLKFAIFFKGIVFDAIKLFCNNCMKLCLHKQQFHGTRNRHLWSKLWMPKNRLIDRQMTLKMTQSRFQSW